jgi:hypothetical protein
MSSLSPQQIALLIIAAVAAVGVIITFIRTRMTFTGYEEITGDVQRLAAALHGELFRDGADVVVSGAWNRAPVVVRFSNAENTPGLNIRMAAPATFVLSVAQAAAEVSEGGRVAVKTADELFDTRFSTRTDQPAQARMFLTRQVTALLQRLCCSRNTYISFVRGAIEVSELLIPGAPSPHVLEHVKTMAALAENLRQMPGAETVKLSVRDRERHVVVRVAMAIGAVVAIGSVFAAVQSPHKTALTQVAAPVSNGILPADAAVIADAERWRAASLDELDGTAAAWLRGNGIEPSSRVEGDFGGSGTGDDAAYLLVGRDGSRRVVVIADHQNRYDASYAYVGLVARIPKADIASIRWNPREHPPQEVDGDGILLVRGRDNGASGLVLFLTRQGVVSATPVNYQEIRLR